MTDALRQVLWVDLTRFDTKPDKSTWLEMGDVLSRRGYRVQLVTSYAVAPYSPRSHDVDVISIPPSRIPGLFRSILLFRTLLTLLRQREPGVIVILPPGALFIAPVLRLFGIRNIHFDVRTVPVSIHGRKKKLDAFIFWNIAMRFFAMSGYSASFITAALQREAEKVAGRRFPRSCIWSSGVRTDAFASTQVPEKGDDRYEFFYHGTITEDRGVITMVEAIQHLAPETRQRIKMKIVGSGPGVEALEALIDSHDWRNIVDYVGFVPYQAIPALLGAADCCICPLPDREEWQVSSPLKVLEYMAAAKPLIATPIAAHTDVLENQSFAVWTQGYDDRAFAEAMELAFHNRDELRQTARSGPEYVRQNFDWEILGARLADHFERYFEDRP